MGEQPQCPNNLGGNMNKYFIINALIIIVTVTATALVAYYAPENNVYWAIGTFLFGCIVLTVKKFIWKR